MEEVLETILFGWYFPCICSIFFEKSERIAYKFPANIPPTFKWELLHNMHLEFKLLKICSKSYIGLETLSPEVLAELQD